MAKLNIIWTTDHIDTSRHMIFMYARNSKLNHWWDEVHIVIWGLRQSLLRQIRRYRTISGSFRNWESGSGPARDARTILVFQKNLKHWVSKWNTSASH